MFVFLKPKYTKIKTNGSNTNSRGVALSKLPLINLIKLINVSPTVKKPIPKISKAVIRLMGIKYDINAKNNATKQEIKNTRKLYLSAVFVGAVIQALPKTKSTDNNKKCLM